MASTHREQARPATAVPVGPLLAAASAVAVLVHVWGLYKPPGVEQAPWFPGADKLEHLVGFAVPLLLVSLTLRWYARRRGKPARIGLPVAAFAAHAAVSELVQARWLPGRTGDPFDVVADLAGVGLAVAAFWAIDRKGP